MGEVALVDEAHRTEARVWLAFVAPAAVTPELATVLRHHYAALHPLLVRLLSEGRAPDPAPRPHDRARPAARPPRPRPHQVPHEQATCDTDVYRPPDDFRPNDLRHTQRRRPAARTGRCGPREEEPLNGRTRGSWCGVGARHLKRSGQHKGPARELSPWAGPESVERVTGIEPAL
ncbi:TetR family transcriptional regulator C-terminal domain-containing protein [Streptomyces sp. RGM 3693]|uniref:TetR family transcriptional regulator C-terminal domain-containing protein n=1 Tax=Streptomyces sp. RGM 3693 TaxID=3413284 RepID=UPI003D295302